MSIPLFEVQFDKQANRITPAQETAIVQAIKAPGANIGHVVVLSHGWNNDMEEARTLYGNFLRHLESVVGVAGAKGIIAIGVLWPSKRFADADLIPGGSASANDPATDRALTERLEDLKQLFGDADAEGKLEQLKPLIRDLHTNPGSQQKFVDILADLVEKNSDAKQRSADEGLAKLSGQDGHELLTEFGMPIASRKVVTGAGGAAGMGGLGGNPALGGGATAAAGIGDFFSGIKAGAMRMLNLVTYQTMKDRAGLVGRDGVNPMLSRIQAAAAPGVKFYLVGHSFGGRLVTATTDGPNLLRVQAMLLLQAAYSHNGLSSDFDGKGGKGFFHQVLSARKVTGPILITHSKHDRAVGLAYPLASRLNGTKAASVGDKNDVFGGMGANGAQKVSSQAMDLKLLPVGGGYVDWTSKAIVNLNGDDTITGHSDVARAETAYVLAKAMALR
jgi:hypothetical protein